MGSHNRHFPVGHDVARTASCNVILQSCVSLLAVLAVLLRIQSKMSLEEEVFKIGKQLEKIVGEEGTVSQ